MFRIFLITWNNSFAVCLSFFISFFKLRFLIWRYTLSSSLNIFFFSDFWFLILFLTINKSSRSCFCLSVILLLSWLIVTFFDFSSDIKRLSFRLVCIFLRQRFIVFILVLLYTNCIVNNSSTQLFCFLLMYARKYCSSV